MENWYIRRNPIYHVLLCKLLMRLEYFYSSVLVVILSISYLNNQVFAWSFQDTWWFGESQSSSIGNIRIIYTYPDEVQSFEPKYNNNSMHVGVALQYIKDKSASANWVVFSNVYVYLKPNTSLSIPPVYSESNTSSAISPGESYYHTFSLKP